MYIARPMTIMYSWCIYAAESTAVSILHVAVVIALRGKILRKHSLLQFSILLFLLDLRPRTDQSSKTR